MKYIGEINNIWIGVNFDFCFLEWIVCVDFLDKIGNVYNLIIVIVLFMNYVDCF